MEPSVWNTIHKDLYPLLDQVKRALAAVEE